MKQLILFSLRTGDRRRVLINAMEISTVEGHSESMRARGIHSVVTMKNGAQLDIRESVGEITELVTGAENAQ